jgi:hypothetical protein
MEKRLIASIMNFVWPGIGYIYTGNTMLGIIILVAYLVICFFLIQIAYVFPFTLIIGLFINIFLAYHVYTIGEVKTTGMDLKVKELMQRYQKIRYTLNMLENKVKEGVDITILDRVNSIKLRMEGADGMVRYVVTNYNTGNTARLDEYIKKTENFLKMIEMEQEQVFNLIYS